MLELYLDWTKIDSFQILSNSPLIYHPSLYSIIKPATRSEEDDKARQIIEIT
jgi:hypothetical protein